MTVQETRSRTRRTRRVYSGTPSLRIERSWQREGFPLIVGMDEVGRGALAGPVSVGAVAVNEATRTVPAGVKDSKLLSPAARVALVPKIQRWARAWAVGHASPTEIDEVGIIAALRLAGQRALVGLADCAGLAGSVDQVLAPDMVLLDGNHDYLTDPNQVGLLAFSSPDQPATPQVETVIKGDMRCSSIAAASVLAKVDRDGQMQQAALDHPAYGWDGNKGYAAPDHLEALRTRGPSVFHRRSWNLTTRDAASSEGSES